ncbi:WD40-repeat-containing domain protein [Sphaerosporella brunnea]|uniref:WD40-repeat-containing domain protein n=1 Tax=Sphaerosporella brunnea TaxID=1250544 RepID=A0A5J5F124_9PEZI|nr:WD40-repeat-containing domain protein [Sphaerosporella brunnea]
MARKSKSKQTQNPVRAGDLVPATVFPEKLPEMPKDQEEAELEKLVFGDLDGFKAGLKLHEIESEQGEEEEPEDSAVHRKQDTSAGQDLAALQDDQLFFIDAGDDNDTALVRRDEDQDVDMTVAVLGQEVQEEAAAWEDSDDDKMMISLAAHSRMRKLRDVEADDFVTGKEYSRRLRRQFERIYPMPNWARPPKSSAKRRRLSDDEGSEESDAEMDVDDESMQTLSAPPLAALLASSTDLTLSKASRKAIALRPEVIDIARLTDANVSALSKSAIQCLFFHPTHPLLLTSGLDSTLRLYHIDGKINPQATSLHIRGAPLRTAMIHPSGTRIIAAGRRRYFHVWDLESGVVEQVTRVYGHKGMQKSMERFDVSPDGKYISFIGSKGSVQIMDATTNQWIATARTEGVVADISWFPNSETLSVLNTVGEIYEYDITTHSVTSVWRDEGGVSSTCISNSPAGARFVAVGCASGIVNIYDRRVSFGGKAPGSMGTPTDPKPVKTVESLVTTISTLEFSRDGQVLCVASRTKKDALRLVHLPSCTIYRNWPTSATPLGKVTAVKWGGNNGGMTLAVGNEAGKVRLFEVRA